MKFKSNLLLACTLWVVSFVTPLAAEPLAVLTVHSYEDLQKSVTRLVHAFDPNAPFDFDKEVGNVLGLSPETVMDRKKPWQLAIWFDGAPQQMVVAAKVPVKDINQFKESLNPNSMMRMMGQDWTQLKGGFGLVTLMKPETLNEAQQSSFKQWKGRDVKRSGKALELNARLSESLRQQALGLLALGKMAMSQSFTTNKAYSASGVNPKAMVDILGVYFEVIGTVVTGMDKLGLGIDVSPDALVLDKTIVPKADTVLAGWLKEPGKPLGDGQKRQVDPKATMSFLGQIGNDPSKMAILNRFMMLGLQMQNIPSDDPSIKQVEKLFNSMFPMTFAVSVYSEESMTFKGSYGFPESKAEDVYAKIKEFVGTGLQGMVGKDKMYTSAVLKEKHRVIDGVSIDRFTIAINTNSPMFNLPGQVEQMKAMWPEGIMEFDYALKGKQLLFASPDKMKDVLAGKGKSDIKPAGGSVGANTAMAGYMNLIDLMKFSIASNPILPEAVKKQVAQLNPEGASAEFRVDSDRKLNSTLQIPLKMFQEFRKMGPPASQPK